MNLHILFVDDEPQVLQGIKRSLRATHPQWSVGITTSGEEALQQMQSEPRDVIVSDMRMPGMDGATLLGEVKKRWPKTVRFVLSGYADQNMAMRAVDSAHQYLSKPCDPKMLSEAIQRAIALRAMLEREEIASMIAEVGALPSPPTVYQEMMDHLSCPTLGMESVARTVEKDPAITAKLLKLVNSSFFGLGRHITSVEQTVTLLGIDLIKTLLLSVHLFGQVKNPLPPIDCLREHSHRVARIAKAIAVGADQNKHDIAASFTAGVLHDIGKIILAGTNAQRYQRVIQKAAQMNVDPLVAERDAFGVTHAEVGAYLLALWNLPDPIVEAVGYHHVPHECVNPNFGPLTAVHIADAIDHHSGGNSQDLTPPHLDQEYLQRIGAPDDLAQWAATYQQDFDEVKSA